jgi:hypothetical protein
MLSSQMKISSAKDALARVSIAVEALMRMATMYLPKPKQGIILLIRMRLKHANVMCPVPARATMNAWKAWRVICAAAAASVGPEKPSHKNAGHALISLQMSPRLLVGLLGL